MSGERNPFWGKSHSAETLTRIRELRKSRPFKGKTGPPKGYRHTPEARAKMSAALRERWRVNRDKMLALYPKQQRPREELRYRRNFTDLQRVEWKESSCKWCGSTEELALDHIIPVMCGGTNERRNAQTLCRSCNVWKMIHVDRALFLAGAQAASGASINPE